MRKTSTARLAGGAVITAAAVALALVGSGAATAAPPTGPNNGGNTPNGPTIDIQLLSFNDFHGNLEPPAGSSGRLNLPGVSRPTLSLLPESAVSNTSRPTSRRRVRGTRRTP